MKLSKHLAEKFFCDPEWERVEEYICSFFDATVDVADIDTDMPSEAVHAEVIARKRIKKSLDAMKNNFRLAKVKQETKKTSFR